MPICEKCATTFETPPGPVQVTSMRVLCPECAAERLEAKRKAAATRDVAPTATKQVNSTPPSPAAKPMPAARAPTPVPASRPAPRPASSAATKPELARPAKLDGKDAGARATATPVNSVAKKSSDAAPRTSARLAAAPATKPEARSAARAPLAKEKKAAVEEPAKHKRSKDVERGSELLKQRANRAVMIGWICAAVLISVAGGVVFKVKTRMDTQKAAVAAAEKAVQDFMREIRSFDITKADEATKVVELAQSKASIWKGASIEADVATLVSKAKTNIEAAAERAVLEERLVKVESALAAPETQTADELAVVGRTIEELEPKAAMVGSEFTARLGAARATIDRVYVAKLHQEAKDAAAAGTTPEILRAALIKYTRAEDETVKRLDKAIKEQVKDKEELFKKEYQEIIQESDVLVHQVFTPEAIEQLAWRDLLSADQIPNWVGTKGVKGFEYRIEKGALYIHGPDADSAGQGLVSIGDREQWRDFKAEIEFTLLHGNSWIYLRLGKQVDKNVEYVTVDTQGNGAVVEGETYQGELELIGSDLRFTVQSVEVPAIDRPVHWTKVRKGAVAFLPGDASEMRITKFRIKVLR